MAPGRRRALLVYKKSTYQLYAIERRSQQVDRLLAADDPVARELRAAHEIHLGAVEQVTRTLEAAGYEVRRTYRARLGKVTGFDLIVSVGGDGTLLDVSHHLETRTPLLGVNSDPAHSVGLLSAADAADLGEHLEDIARGRLTPTLVSRLQLELDGAPLPVLALNDVLVAHHNPAATSRYVLQIGRRAETQMSSGLWLASGVGSTAAMRSSGGQIRPLDDVLLQYRVREPYDGKGQPHLVSGSLNGRQSVQVRSAMRDGRIYVDGPHVRFPFGLGAVLTVRVRPRSLSVYISAASLRRREALV